MTLRFPAALLTSAALFLFALSPAIAQPPVVDASLDPRNQQPAAGPGPDASLQSELFTQLQLLQEEVMQLRGLVEQQTYELEQLKQQNMERYIDLDRRIANLGGSADPETAAPGPAGATAAQPPATASQVRELPGEKSAYESAYRLVTARAFDQALKAFTQFLVDYPDGRYAPNSYYWLGELYQVVQPKDLEASRQAFQQLVTRYPDNAKAADAMYKLGKVYYELGNRAEARRWLDKVVSDFGAGVNPAADKARQFLADNY